MNSAKQRDPASSRSASIGGYRYSASGVARKNLAEMQFFGLNETQWCDNTNLGLSLLNRSLRERG